MTQAADSLAPSAPDQVVNPAVEQPTVLSPDEDFKRFLLAGLRVAWLKTKLALDEIEDVAVALKSGGITPDQAAKHCLIAGIIAPPGKPDGD